MNKKYKKVDFKFYLIKNSKFFPQILLGKLLLAFVFIFTFSSFAQESDPVKGKALFNSNCAACHKLDKKNDWPCAKKCRKQTP
jgi:energy-coupling factor transporter transmembrane protein EcfT